ncbi:MAG TPA: hypothetical protein ACFYEK_15555 [Candidatus Wunengus sp. YC60]|uniref:hypothetical protein n=1 Tax=Candidatus Wunengus sp. YC60 TaxID=3367697 RepID=UPI00402954CB
MKIICSRCKMFLGEQEPFDNPAEIKAKCTGCITKEKEEASRFTPKPLPGQKQEIVLENGLKGVLWVAQGKKDKLFLGELAVSGKKFCCTKSGREKFQEYLRSLKGEETDITFLHSVTVKLDPAQKGRKKKENPPKTEEPKKNNSIEYNCTMRAPKYYVQLMFNDMAERMDRVIEMLAEASYEAYKKDCQKEVKKV